jgi:serine protease Do
LGALPDFTTLVEKEGAAVVNISTTQTLRGRGALPPFPGMDPDDPFYDFFRRFMPPQPPGHPNGPRDREYQTHSLGSGFIISADGYVLTNAHVIDNADEVVVKLTDKREFKAKVIGKDKRTDVALVKIDAKNLPTVTLGDAAKVKVGEWVVAIGSPYGFENSVTAGIVSAKGRSLPGDGYVPFIQTDVAVNPGNSGGPLFNMRGEVVGVNSQIYSRTGGYMGLSFAIPIDIALDVSNQLKGTGKVSRGKLGVVIQEVSPDLAASFGMKDAKGAVVSQVEPGGAADKAGIQPGDVVVKFDGKDVPDSTTLPRMVGAVKPGSKVKVEIWRNKGMKEITLALGEWDGEVVAAVEDDKADKPAKANRLGLALTELTAQQKSRLKVSGGVLVQSVSGAAERAGVQPGDVVLALNNDKVSSVDQFAKLLKQSEGAKTVALLILRGDRTLFVPVKMSE